MSINQSIHSCDSMSIFDLYLSAVVALAVAAADDVAVSVGGDCVMITMAMV